LPLVGGERPSVAKKNQANRRLIERAMAPVISAAMQRTSPHRGFTLVELLVVMAIIGIIAVFAYPSYEAYVVRNNRAAAQAVLLDVAQRQQQYLLDTRSYATWAQITAAGVTVPSNVSQFYTFDTAPLGGPPPTFTATATPRTSTRQAADATLQIDQAGVKTPAGKW
jgi:type IV pilus assembly protein PilE